MGIAVVVVVAVVVLAVGMMIVAKNRFATMRNLVEEAWRQVDVELQRRHDLIGNLVEVAKASARFEQQTLAQVVQARALATAATGAGQQGWAEQQLAGALTQFFHVAESYPDLRANKDFRYLQEQMADTENRIATGRQNYNGKVNAYNTKFDTFPSSMFTGGHQKAQYFEVDDPAKRAAPSLRGAFDGLNSGQPQLPPQPPQGQTGEQGGEVKWLDS